MSRASSPVDPQPNESPSNQVNSEIIRVASQLSEDIIELAIKEVANSPTVYNHVTKDSEKQNLMHNNEVKEDDFDESHGVPQGIEEGVPQGLQHGEPQGEPYIAHLMTDLEVEGEMKGQTDIQDLNVKIKQRKVEQINEVESAQENKRASEEEIFHTDGMAVGPDVQIDLDDVITSESNVFINQVR